MNLKLMYITNNPEIAMIADRAGVDWIFIDLEKIGKIERQGHIDSVKSNHEISDIKAVKSRTTNAKLLVRINPIHKYTEKEINEVIKNGAEIIMLPFFTKVQEVEKFLQIVNKRAKTILLLETPQAVDEIEKILLLDGIDFIHIGLNDLHLGYKKKFMFELISDGTVEMLSHKFNTAQVPFGFGGVANLNAGKLPAEIILAEHYRLQSEMVILSRSFIDIGSYSDQFDLQKVFSNRVKEIRNFEAELLVKEESFFQEKHNELVSIVNEIVEEM